MVCDFKRTSKEWICAKCGRRSPIKQNKQFMPTAKCRLPEFYNSNCNYIHNKRIKGVGDMLSELIRSIGYDYEPISSTRTALTYLNKRGIDWCSDNQSIILEWFKYECLLQNIIFIERPIKALIRLAIIKAKNQIIID